MEMICVEGHPIYYSQEDQPMVDVYLRYKDWKNPQSAPLFEAVKINDQESVTSLVSLAKKIHAFIPLIFSEHPMKHHDEFTVWNRMQVVHHLEVFYDNDSLRILKESKIVYLKK